MKINKVSKLNGIITVPADKSITHRAIMLSSLATGKSYINNLFAGYFKSLTRVAKSSPEM